MPTAAARRWWPSSTSRSRAKRLGTSDPIGRTIQCGLDTLDQMPIVGVAADIRTLGPASPVQSEIYMPFEQHPGPSTSLNIVARTTREDSLAMAETIRRRIASRNPDVPVKAFTMEGTLETASETQRFRTVLLVSFAGVALVLALAGIYGVMSYVVTQRVPELGVRIALGAAPSSILGLVIRQGAVLALAGVASASRCPSLPAASSTGCSSASLPTTPGPSRPSRSPSPSPRSRPA